MKAIRLIIPFLLVVFMACQKDEDFGPITEDPSSRVTLKNEQVQVVPPAVGLKTVPAEQLGFSFTLVAEVDAPTLGDYVLQATQVELVGNMALVSYNFRGPDYRGGIDIIDVSNPHYPQIIKTFLLDNADVNSVGWYNNQIVIAGQDIDGAFYGLIDPQGPYGQPFVRYRLPSRSAVSLGVIDGYGYFVTGDDGGLTLVNLNNHEVIGFMPFYDARSVALVPDNGRAYLLTSQNINLFPQNITVPVDPGFIQTHSKADIDATENYVFAALNRGGVNIYNPILELVQNLPRPATPQGLDEEDFVSNSVSFNNPLLFVANGGAGISVNKYTESLTNPFVEYGYFDFGGPLSSNFVKSKEEFIFVATGLGGLKILTFTENQPDECTEWQAETAFAGSLAGPNNAWWYIFETGDFEFNKEVVHPIFAGQKIIPGASVTYWNHLLVIDLGPYMRLKEGDETVKIQGYNHANELPTRRPPAGQFTTYKGNELMIEVGHYNYFVIHLDVEVCKDLPITYSNPL